MKNKANIEVFKGFQSYGMKYPEYQVITPQSLKSYTIRTLTVEDEENLKGSLLSPSKVPYHLANVLWNCLVKKPDEIKTFEDFISKTTMKDRDALLFGLYQATYKNIQKYTVTCNKCGFANQVKIDTDKWFSAKTWLERGDNFENVLSYRPSVDLKVFDGVSCVLKSPTMKDEITISEDTQFSSEQVSNMQMKLSMIDKFVIKASEQCPNGDTVEDRDNILTAYNSLTASDKKLIDEAYVKEFGDYEIKVSGIVKCTKCKEQRPVEIDVSQQFFRSLYE